MEEKTKKQIAIWSVVTGVLAVALVVMLVVLGMSKKVSAREPSNKAGLDMSSSEVKPNLSGTKVALPNLSGTKVSLSKTKVK
jgi:hypothetical protein